jgi:hypothetical protein
MRTQSADTNPIVEKKLIDLIKQQSISQRLSRAVYLTSVTLNLSKRAIAVANPTKSKPELDLLFVEYHYGIKLANLVKNYIQKRNEDKE